MSDCDARDLEFKSWSGQKITKVMGSYGNCKYLPMFSLSYVKYAFVTVYDCIILSYGMCGVNLALV